MPLPTKLPKKYELFFGLNLDKEQKALVDLMMEKDIVFVDAPTGTGKTTLTVLLAKIIRDIDPEYTLDYIFSPIMEKAMGYRAGDQSSKNAVYLTALHDALGVMKENPRLAIYNEDERLKDLVDRFWIYPQPVTFLRGSTKIKKVTIIDEAQNYTYHELKKAISRHKEGKMFVIGNMVQCDLKNPAESGFHHFLEWFAKDSRAGVGKLSTNFRGWVSKHADECPPMVNK